MTGGGISEGTTGATGTIGGLFVERSGTGRPVIALHGGLGTHVTWLPFVAAAAGVVGCEFWLVDHPGHGRSPAPTAPLTYPLIADAVAGLIAEAGLDRPVVMGWSDGGQAALELAVRHPGLAGALVVGGASARFATELREKHRQLLGADEQNRPNLHWLDLLLGDEGPTIRSWHPGGDEQWRAVVEASAHMWLTYPGLDDEQVAGIDVPVLVLGADHDELVPPAGSADLFGMLTDAELAVVPAADHDAIRTDAGAPGFVGPVAGFLDRHPVTAGPATSACAPSRSR